MNDLRIYRTEKAGRITLTRQQALNALTHEMCRDILAALTSWRDDADVAVVLIDAEGERAFCAGGDVQEIYAAGQRGDYDTGRAFWADEYRMNAMIADYPKPVVTLMQGFTMGGGVGLGCHASHRIVCETSQIAMPEVAIGLIPDVGGTYLLAHAPGRIGEYLGTTAARMGQGDAIYAGFADLYIPQEFWIDVTTRLESSGDLSVLAAMAEPAPTGPIQAAKGEIDATFAGAPGEIEPALAASDTPFATASLTALRRASPLAVACTLANIRSVRESAGDVRAALAAEYRFTWRAADQGDLLEGIRAAIIDKDKAPRWQHASLAEVSPAEVARLLAPLGQDELEL